MPPELLPALTQGGPFVAALAMAAWLVPLALRTIREVVEGFRLELKRHRRVLRRMTRSIERLNDDVAELKLAVTGCPPVAGPPPTQTAK